MLTITMKTVSEDKTTIQLTEVKPRNKKEEEDKQRVVEDPE